MATQEEFTDDFLREKMKKWFRRDKLEDSGDRFISQVVFSSLFPLWGIAYLGLKPSDVESEIRDLKRRVRQLEKMVGEEREPTKADYVYARFKEELEEKHFGKIVAIDIDSEEIVGIGNSVLEAYHNAKEESGKTKFAYKRVGYDYVYKLG